MREYIDEFLLKVYREFVKVRIGRELTLGDYYGTRRVKIEILNNEVIRKRNGRVYGDVFKEESARQLSLSGVAANGWMGADEYPEFLDKVNFTDYEDIVDKLANEIKATRLREQAV
jgi:hypothetical protein